MPIPRLSIPDGPICPRRCAAACVVLALLVAGWIDTVLPAAADVRSSRGVDLVFRAGDLIGAALARADGVVADAVVYLPSVRQGSLAPPEPFEPKEHTDLEPGTYVFESIHIPGGVTVTVKGDVIIHVVGDALIEGALTGDCAGIEVVGQGDVVVMGRIDNVCVEEAAGGGDDTASGGDLRLQSVDGSIQVGDIAAGIEAELSTSGYLGITVGDDMPDWWFDILPEHRSSVKLPPACQARADVVHDTVYEDIDAEMNFSGSAVDPDGGGVRYAWDFGDGTGSSEQHPAHSFGMAGSFDVELTATDDDGQTCRVNLHVVVDDGGPDVPGQPAVWAGAFELAAAVGDEIWFTADAADAADQDLSFHWDFGDGSTSDAAEPSHSYAAPGVHRVALTVTDTDGLSATAAAAVYAYADEPVATAADDVKGDKLTPEQLCGGEKGSNNDYGLLVNGKIKQRLRSGKPPKKGGKKLRGIKVETRKKQRFVFGPKTHIDLDSFDEDTRLPSDRPSTAVRVRVCASSAKATWSSVAGRGSVPDMGKTRAGRGRQPRNPVSMRARDLATAVVAARSPLPAGRSLSRRTRTGSGACGSSWVMVETAAGQARVHGTASRSARPAGTVEMPRRRRGGVVRADLYGLPATRTDAAALTCTSKVVTVDSGEWRQPGPATAAGLSASPSHTAVTAGAQSPREARAGHRVRCLTICSTSSSCRRTPVPGPSAEAGAAWPVPKAVAVGRRSPSRRRPSRHRGGRQWRGVGTAAAHSKPVRPGPIPATGARDCIEVATPARPAPPAEPEARPRRRAVRAATAASSGTRARAVMAAPVVPSGTPAPASAVRGETNGQANPFPAMAAAAAVAGSARRSPDPAVRAVLACPSIRSRRARLGTTAGAVVT